MAVAQQHPVGTQRAARLLSTRWAAGRVSFSCVATSTSPTMAASATAQNTPRQPATAITPLPTSGARMGETLNTSISSDIIRAASLPV